MGWPELSRIAEIIAESGDGKPDRRGSGYRVTHRGVLTATHVIAGATRIRVRFSSDLPGEWITTAEVAVADRDSDIAILEIDSPDSQDDVVPAVYGTAGHRAAVLDCEAVGFPLFKMRNDADGTRYRDSHQANGTVSPLSNWREGTREMLVRTPAPRPVPGQSPWEGMSGAAVWCKGRIIGVISKNHPGDGLGSLAVAGVEGLYRASDAAALDTATALAWFPEELTDVSDPAYAGEMTEPYRGLQAFREGDSRFFFGREEVVSRLQELLVSEPFVALVGASGSGKTSVLSAGLVTAVSASADSAYHCERIAPGDNPEKTLENALSRWAGDSPLLLIVDQMEELHTQCGDDAERRAFIRNLLGLIQGDSPQNRVVIGVRTDFLAQCRQDPDLGPFMRDREVDLWPMSRDELRTAIERPAALVGLHIDPALTQVLLDDVGNEPGKLPLLAHALLATFRVRRGPQLTMDDYIAVGRVQGALDKSANEVYERLSLEEQDEALAILLRCTAGDGKIPDTRRPLPSDDLDAETFPHADTVVARFAAPSARLVTARDGVIEVAHEALLRSWGLMQGWLAAYRPYRAAHQGVMTQARKWKDHGRSPEWLYQEGDLKEAQQLAQSGNPAVRLNRLELAFLEASGARARKRARRWRIAIASIVVITLAAAAGGGIAYYQTGQSAAQNRIATAGKAITEATSSDPGLARQLMVAAYKTASTDQTKGALLNSQSLPREYDFKGTVRTAAYSPRAPILAVGTDRGFTLMGSATGTVISSVASSTGYVDAVAFDPHFDLLVTGDAQGELRLWDVTDPAHPTQEASLRFPQIVETLAFTANGLLTVTLDNNAIGLVDVSDPASPYVVSALPGYSTVGLFPASALSPDGKVLAVGGANDTVHLWNITNPVHPAKEATMAGPASTVATLAFSPDGHILVAGAFLGSSSLRVWDVTDPHNPRPRQQLSSGAEYGSALAFAPGQDVLAVAAGKTVQVWDLADPFNPSQVATLTGHSDTVNTVAFSADGQTLATGSDDQTLCMWSVTNAGHSAPLAEINARAAAPPVLSADGRFMIAGSPPALWDITDPGRPSELFSFPLGQPAAAGQVTFSPDGRFVGTQAANGTITVWSMAHPRRPRPVAHWTAQRGSIAFVDGGRELADVTTSSLFLWDISDPARPTARGSTHVPPVLAQANLSAENGAVLTLSKPATARTITALATRSKGASLMAVSPDGNTLAMAKPRPGETSQIVTLWDVGKSPATELATLTAPNSEATATAAFSPDGKTLAFPDAQGMSLWNVSSPTHPTLITTFTGGSGFTAAGFNSRGGMLATVDLSGDVDLWDLNPASVIHRLCSGTGAPISQAQWNKYLPGFSYARPCPASVRPENDTTTLAVAKPTAVAPLHQDVPASASPALELRGVNWANAVIPGQFCGIPGTVRLRAARATASSARWGQVQFYEDTRVIYGNLGGDVQQIAAVPVMCTNGVGTAEGQLVDAYVIFTGSGGKLTAIGAITPQKQDADEVHVPLFSGLSISNGTITAREDWYRPTNETCCPTGKATTVWTYKSGQFTPDTPDITS